MRVDVLVGMHVLMRMDGSVGVCVNVRVGTVSDGATQTPRGVGETEAEEQPSGHVAADALDPFEVEHTDADGDAHEAEDRRAKDVSDAAEEGDDDGAFRRPASRFGHGNERDVVIGSEEGVADADSGGGCGEDPEVLIHGSHCGRARRLGKRRVGL